MNGVSYKPIIDDMRWSFSRIDSYNQCPYRFFLKYIKDHNEEPRFYSSYGSFIHNILERFYKNEIGKEEMLNIFLSGFRENVTGEYPEESVVTNYIRAGCDYLKGFSALPYECLGVEKEIHYRVCDFDFIGYIDYIGKDNEDRIYIVDHKSKNLKQRNPKRQAGNAKLDETLRQLYLYSIAVEQEYGKLPSFLCFNCFRTGVFIKEEFDIQKYEEAKRWAVDCIDKIANTEDFMPNQNYFYCRYLCGLNNYCEFDIEAREERRRR